MFLYVVQTNWTQIGIPCQETGLRVSDDKSGPFVRFSLRAKTMEGLSLSWLSSITQKKERLSFGENVHSGIEFKSSCPKNICKNPNEIKLILAVLLCTSHKNILHCYLTFKKRKATEKFLQALGFLRIFRKTNDTNLV